MDSDWRADIRRVFFFDVNCAWLAATPAISWYCYGLRMAGAVVNKNFPLAG